MSYFTDMIITGEVTDQAGNPLQGVHLIAVNSRGSELPAVIEHLPAGTTTRSDGTYYFMLPVIPGFHFLRFSHIGYKTRTIPAADLQLDGNVMLEKDYSLLPEVVIDFIPEGMPKWWLIVGALVVFWVIFK